MFKDGWNSHIRTTGKSPQQILVTSRNEHLDELEEVDELYGVDEDGPIPVDDSEGIEVPPVTVTLSLEVMVKLSSVDPLANSDSIGLVLMYCRLYYRKVLLIELTFLITQGLFMTTCSMAASTMHGVRGTPSTAGERVCNLCGCFIRGLKFKITCMHSGELTRKEFKNFTVKNVV